MFLSAVSSSALAADLETVPFEDATQKQFTLEDFKGKTVILNLWATWCGPCIAEMPSLAKLQQDYKEKGLVVLAVSEDDMLSDAVNYFKNARFSGLPSFYDSNHGMMQALSSRGIPTTVLIDAQGRKVQVLEGSIDWQSPEAIKEIDALIAAK